jgi:hypothetical protein
MLPVSVRPVWLRYLSGAYWLEFVGGLALHNQYYLGWCVLFHDAGECGERVGQDFTCGLSRGGVRWVELWHAVARSRDASLGGTFLAITE